MFQKFLYLEWKSFTRSASFKMNLILKILLGISALFYGFLILSLGVGVFFLLKESGKEPLSTVNQFLIYWLVFDLVTKYFLQQSPIMKIKPLLTFPISKNKIVSYLLGKSSISFFNIYPAFFFVPFSIVLMLNGYSILGVLSWHIALFALTYANNYLNLLINNKNGVFIFIASLLVLCGGLQYFDYWNITRYTQPFFQALYTYPFLGPVLLALPIILGYFCFKLYKQTLNLDEGFKAKENNIKAGQFNWLERFGTMGNFLKNDLKLLQRNKRSKTTVMMSFFFIFYGLLIINNQAYAGPMWKLFAGIFVSGGFLFTFGGFVPSWDSSYYPLMMSQNIKYKEYISSKWWLMVLVTFASMIVGSFYLYFGWEVYWGIIVGGIYNIGVNSHLVLLGGAYVKTPIDLTSGKKAFGDKKSFNLRTLLITIPKLVLPLIIFFIFYKIFNVNTGYLAVAILGILGLAFRNKVFTMIEKVYRKEKYATLAAYKENN